MKKTETLDISLFGKSSGGEGFYVNTLSDHLKTSHMHIHKPHKHDFYVFVFFTAGHGTHEIDFTHYEVGPGSVFLMSPGQVHSWNLSSDAEGFVFFHTAGFYGLRYGNESIRDYPFFASLSNPRHVVAEQDNSTALIGICLALYDEYQDNALFRERMVAGLMTSAYVRAARLMQAQKVEAPALPVLYRQKFEAFEDLVELHFRDIKSAAVYAGMLSVTPRHLNRIAQEAAGKMTTEVITDRVMLEARRMMAWSQRPLNEIAFELGYDDYAYFSKLFRKKTGKTPSEFVKAIGHRD